MDGYLESCLGSKCPVSCCNRGYGEPMSEFLESFREQNQDKLKALGINVKFHNGYALVSNCTDGIDCKLLENFEGDVRSLACKIFPYQRGWLKRGDDIRLAIHLNPCPATQPEYSVPEEFTAEVLEMIKEHEDKQLEAIITEKPQEA